MESNDAIESVEKTSANEKTSHSTSSSTNTTIATTEEETIPVEKEPKVNFDSTVTEVTEESLPNEATTEEKEIHVVTKIHADEDDEKDPEQELFIDKNAHIFGDPEESMVHLDAIVSYIDTTELTAEEEEDSLELYDYFGKIAEKEKSKLVVEPINRELIIAEIQRLQEDKYTLRKKNNLLHRKLTEYYKKRKLEQVFQDSYTDLYEHLYEKYERKVDELYVEREKWLKEKTELDDEIANMQQTKILHIEYLNKILNNLLAREKEIGALLIDPNTGKKMQEKVYDRYIQRQRTKNHEIAEIRLVFIKQRDKVKEIENRLKSLETIDGTLHLMDFEQLRMENTTYADKIEERDEELMRLRERYSHANSVLAHTREKSNVIVEDIEEKKEECVQQGYNVSEIREYLNELKVKRDANRSQAEKLNLNSGLLTYPRLLIDMEESLKLEDSLNNELRNLKKINRNARNKLLAIRNAIEQQEHVLTKRSTSPSKSFEKKKRYHGRPTIYKPNISGLIHNQKNKLSF